MIYILLLFVLFLVGNSHLLFAGTCINSWNGSGSDSDDRGDSEAVYGS